MAIIRPVVRKIVRPIVRKITSLLGVIEFPYFSNISRLLSFSSGVVASEDTIDSVGDETRTLQPDHCITVDGIGGGAYFSTPILDNVTKWAVGFRMSNYVQGNLDFIIGGSGGKNILLDRDTYLGFRDSTGSYYRFDGTGNSQEIVTTNLGTFDVFMYADGTNIYAWVDGEYKGYITPSDTTIYVDRLVNGYVTGGVSYYIPKGDHYDYRLYDLTSKSATEITDYFDEQGAKFHHNKMEVSDNWKFHRYLMNEKGLAACLDSGNVDTKNNGVYFYDDVSNPVDYLHNPTLFPTQLRNFHNKEGWNKGAYFNGDGNIEYSQDYVIRGDTIGEIEIDFIISEFTDAYPCIIANKTTNARLQATDAVTFCYDDNGNIINFGSILEKGIVHKAKLYSNGAGVITLDINGNTASTEVDLTQTFTFNKLGQWRTATNRRFNGYILGWKYNGVYVDELNGSTTGTATNVDFNKVLIPNLPNQETDIFGRTPLYKGIAKYNSEVYGGVVGDFDGASDLYVSDTPDNTNTVRILFKTSSSARMGLGVAGNGFYTIYINNGVIGCGSSAGVGVATIDGGYNDGEWHYVIINKLGENNFQFIVDGVDKSGGGNTGYRASNRFSIGAANIAGAKSLFYDGQMALFETDISKYYLNNAYNSISGDEATNNGVIFTEVDYTPQSTIDAISKGWAKVEYGENKLPSINNTNWVGGTGVVISDGVITYSSITRDVYTDSSDVFEQYKIFKLVYSMNISSGSITIIDYNGAVLGTLTNGVNNEITLLPVTATTGRFYFRASEVTGTLSASMLNEVLPTPLAIPNPQFTIRPIDTYYPPKGFNMYPYCKVDFDPIVWETYKSYKNIESLDFATDTLAGISGTATNAVTFDGYSDVLSFWADGNNLTHFLRYTNTILQDNNYRVITQIYLPSTNTNVDEVNVSNGYSDDGYMAITDTDKWVSVNLEINDTHSQSTLEIYLYSGGVLTFAGANSSTDDIIYVRNLIVDEVIEHQEDATSDYPVAIGYRPHLMFLPLCYVGNPYGLPEYYPAGITAYIDYENPYAISAELLQYMLENVDTDEEGFIYLDVNEYNSVWLAITTLIVYRIQKTDWEQEQKLSHYLPDYQNLPVHILDDNNIGIYDDYIEDLPIIE